MMCCVFVRAIFRGGFLHTRGYDPVLAVLLFSGALALHSRQLDLKLRLDYLWATQVGLGGTHCYLFISQGNLLMTSSLYVMVV